MPTDDQHMRDGNVGRRTDARLRLMLPASLRLPVAKENCWLENISRTGALVRIEQLPPVDSTAIFKFMHLTLWCTVVWVQDNWCGLQFDEPLPSEAVLRFRSVFDHYPEHEQAHNEHIARSWVSGEA
jgi:hypothetical protein